MVEIPLLTELDADGDGKIGAQLATYAKLSRRAASGPIEAAGKAGKEFVRMVQIVGQGKPCCYHNFKFHTGPSAAEQCGCLRDSFHLYRLLGSSLSVGVQLPVRIVGHDHAPPDVP